MDIVTALNDPRTIATITMQGTNERDGDYYATGPGTEL